MRWWVRPLGQVGGPLLLLPLLFMGPAARCAFVVLVMALYWTFELLPLAVTALLPVVLFPLLGVASTNATSLLYMKGTNMMYLGSLMMALAVEESGLHKRIALKALLLAGTSPSRIMLGFMVPTAFLSMWISNAATTAMMLPILAAVLDQLGLSPDQRAMMLLSIAFSSNVGGTGTIIGTPPNLILLEFLGIYEGHPLNFGSWMVFALPQVVLNILFVWLVLQIYFKKEDFMAFFLALVRKYYPTDKEIGVRRIIGERYQGLGPMTFHEGSVLGLFIMLILTWFTRSPGFMPGWADYLEWTVQGKRVVISSATPTILVFSLLFCIPRDPSKDPTGPALLSWNEVQKKFPWGIILLMGGGFALAEGARLSCLSDRVGVALSSLSVLPTPIVLGLLCLVTSAVSQIASNSATVSMILPVVLEIADSLKVNPLYLAVGVTLTASNAFMLPVSTPSNAIVYTAGGIRTKDMVCVGLVLGLLCLMVTLLSLHTYGAVLYDLHQFPDWANITRLEDSSCHLH